MKINLSTDKSRRYDLSKDSIHRYQDAEGPGIFLYKRYAGDQCSLIVKRLDLREYNFQETEAISREENTDRMHVLQ